MNFEVKVKLFNSESEKMETEVLLIEANTFGEAEAIALDNVPEHTDILAISKSKFDNIKEDDKDLALPFWHCENKDLVIDEVTGKEAKRKITYLIKAEANAEANEVFNEILDSKYGAEIDITKVQKTAITQFIERAADGN